MSATDMVTEYQSECLDVPFLTTVAYTMPHDLVTTVGCPTHHCEISIAFACQITYKRSSHEPSWFQGYMIGREEDDVK